MITAANEQCLDVAQVGKAYGSVVALAGVDLILRAGEYVVLLGPNGAGKSTLFQLLSGLFMPDEGTIKVRGFDMGRESVRALAGIGIVFQQPTLDLDLTVLANLRFHARLHGMRKAEREARIDEELTRLGIEQYRHTPARALSGGSRRRVELARAMLHGPDLLLMDEPTVGLDPESRQALLQHVRGLCHDRGLAVLWATHLVDEADAADRAYVLHQGRVVAQGTPEEIRRRQSADTLLEAFLNLVSFSQ